MTYTIGRPWVHPPTPPMPAPRRAAVVFIFVTVLLDVMALGLILPVLPRLVIEFSGDDTAVAAEVYGLFGLAWAGMQFVFSPILGALSDRFGRRPVLLVSVFGLGLDYVLMALAPDVGWLLAGRIISGITAASFTTAAAYVADVTKPEDRAAGFGMLGSAFGLGFVLGPAIGGLLGGFDPRLPFWVAAGLALANGLYGLFVLPESLPRERRATRWSWSRANPIGALGLLGRQRRLAGLATVSVLFYLAHEVLQSVGVLHATHRYGWDEASVGLSLAATGVCGMVVQGLLVKPVVARFGERAALLVGLVFGIAGFVLFAVASTGVLAWAAIPVFALWGLYGPASQSLMSRRVDATEQGTLQGALTALRGLTGLVGPLLFTSVFARAVEGAWGLGPGAPYGLAAAVLVVALVIAVAASRSDADRR